MLFWKNLEKSIYENSWKSITNNYKLLCSSNNNQDIKSIHLYPSPSDSQTGPAVKLLIKWWIIFPVCKVMPTKQCIVHCTYNRNRLAYTFAIYLLAWPYWVQRILAKLKVKPKNKSCWPINWQNACAACAWHSC